MILTCAVFEKNCCLEAWKEENIENEAQARNIIYQWCAKLDAEYNFQKHVLPEMFPFLFIEKILYDSDSSESGSCSSEEENDDETITQNTTPLNDEIPEWMKFYADRVWENKKYEMLYIDDVCSVCCAIDKTPCLRVSAEGDSEESFDWDSLF